MNPPADSAARPKPESPSAALRNLPSVDELLSRSTLARLADSVGRSLVTQAARNVLAAARTSLKEGRDHDPSTLESQIAAEVHSALASSLRPVINATGVILHTNLGRAPLAPAAAAEIASTAARYSNLEYDIPSGERGKRDVHTSRLLAQLTGAEAAVVVNNNAAAVFLVLNTLAKGAEVVVSRGELIEIGDGFRIPDIMAESGAILREVGTTNRTRIRDYERAINERTRLLLRVHPSNFRITGFTERPSLDELAALGRRTQTHVYEDLGSGCLADLASSGVAEPVARESFAAGVDVVSFSGDKLLGGPQAGIIAGRKDLVDRIRRNPLFRALRVDKLTVAALEVTLKSYLRGALDEIPALRMIRTAPDEIRDRAERLAAQLCDVLPQSVGIEIREGHSIIGGGSTPDQQLATHLISISSERTSATALEEKLRKPASNATPVIARIEEDRLVLDLRTVLIEEEAALVSTLASALA